MTESGWHRIELIGGEWVGQMNHLVKVASDLCFASAPEKAAILSKELPGFRGARVYLSPEVTPFAEGATSGNRLVPCSAPGPQDFDSVEFEIGTEWQEKLPSGRN